MTEDMARTLILVHGVAGLAALALGLTALALPKRAGPHPVAGRAYLVAVLIAIAIAAPVILGRGNLFLVGMGLLVIAHGAVAFGAARYRPTVVGPMGRGLASAAGLGFLGFGAWGAWALTRGAGMGLVVVVMAAIGGVLVRRVWTHDGPWRDLHVHGAAGALISAVTAFAAATGPRIAPFIPEPVLWIAPAVLLTPWFVRQGRAATKAPGPRSR